MSNFQPLEVVSRYRDSQPQVVEKLNELRIKVMPLATEHMLQAVCEGCCKVEKIQNIKKMEVGGRVQGHFG